MISQQQSQDNQNKQVYKSENSTDDRTKKHILDDEERLPFLHGATKIINALLIIVVVPGYVFLLFFGTFIRITLWKTQHFGLNLSLLTFISYTLIMVSLAIYNDSFKIPRLKKLVSQANLPLVGIQIIGRGEVYEQFFAVLNNMRNIKYPSSLIKRTVLALDGTDNKNDDMVKVFKKLFPLAGQIQLEKHFCLYSQQEKHKILEQNKDRKYLIIRQPHGGRRQIKYTAFQFSSYQTQYVFHSDSDTIVGKQALYNLAKTAAGYNIKNPDLKPCGGVVGEIKIINVFNYFVFHMEISYWFAFHASRSSQSALNCVATISGAMGLFHSKGIRSVLQDYAHQTFLCGKIKCVFGQDRHLTTGLIVNGYSVLYDNEAQAMTESPKSVHSLVIQQTRWSKGFYRENVVFLPYIFQFNVWTVLSIMISFALPILTLLHLFYSQIQGLNKLAFFSFFVFCISAIASLRVILRTGNLRFIHALWHPLFYYFFLMPCKLQAMFDLIFQDNKKCCESICKKVFHVYLWLIVGGGVVVGYGLFYNIIVKDQKIITWLAVALIIEGAALIFLLVHWLTWGLGYYVSGNIKKHAERYEIARSQGFQNIGETNQALNGPRSFIESLSSSEAKFISLYNQ